MKKLLVRTALLASVIIASNLANAQNGRIEIAPGNGVYDTVCLVPGVPELNLKFTNNTGSLVNLLSVGFKVSSVGGWGRLDPSIWPIDKAEYPSFRHFFNASFQIFSGANQGEVDTIGLWARGDSDMFTNSLPLDWNENSITVGLGYMDQFTSATHVCIDTCSVMPDRQWRWESTWTNPTQTFIPEFVGLPGQAYQSGVGPDRVGSGYCFEVQQQNFPPYMNYPPGTLLTGTFCQPFAFDFNAVDMEGDPIIEYQKVSGPGTIDPQSGLWTWTDITTADLNTHSVVVRAKDAGSNSWGPSFTLNLLVNPAPAPELTGGCYTSTLHTGTRYTVRMTTAETCDDYHWNVWQILGPPTGAISTISPTGVFSFEVYEPGLYEIRVEVSDGLHADTCSHTFIVHGGPGCCIGTRGNVNLNGGVDLSDLSLLLAYMTVPFTTLPCVDAANVSSGGPVDISDLSWLIAYLTTTPRPTLPSCP